MLFPRDEYYLIDDILDESAAGVAPRASLHPAAEHFFSKLAGDNPCQIKPDRGYRGGIYRPITPLRGYTSPCYVPTITKPTRATG